MPPLKPPARSAALFLYMLPVAVWTHRLPQKQLLTYTFKTIEHCTSAIEVIGAVSAYCVALAHLLANHGDRSGALDAAREFVVAFQNETLTDWLDKALGASDPSLLPMPLERVDEESKEVALVTGEGI